MNACGLCAFQFYKNGEWNGVVVDTFIPCEVGASKPLYAHCGDSNEFWLPLLEKAYAKLHGSYEVILDILYIVYSIYIYIYTYIYRN